MTSYTYINEASIIPQNFNWRAGVGKQVDANQPAAFSPFNNGFTPNNSFQMPQGMSPMDVIKNGQKRKEDLAFNQQLIQEIDTNVTDILDKHKQSMAKQETFNQIKTEIRLYMMGLYTKYKDMIGPKFMELLYNTCLRSYTNQWVIICGANGIQDLAQTEFVKTAQGIEINPFVIWTILNTCLTKQEYVYEGQINE